LQHGIVHLCFEQYPSPSAILSFLYTTIHAGFHDSLTRFLELQIMFFFSFNPKETTSFVPPLCQLQTDMKRGTSPSSNGWDFIPNTDGWDEVLMWKVMTDDHRIGIRIF
jgi:hypothetical protein